MELISAETHGWEALRLVVFRRDRGCIAARSDVFKNDVAQELCRDASGWIIPAHALHKMEFDHVKEDLAISLRADDDEAHGVTACPWHHRLSRKWRTDTKEHRAIIRLYLARLYPDVWVGLPSDGSLT